MQTSMLPTPAAKHPCCHLACNETMSNGALACQLKLPFLFSSRSLLRTSGSPESTRALCKLLVRARADPNCGDSITGESPLMEAACLGDRRLAACACMQLQYLPFGQHEPLQETVPPPAACQSRYRAMKLLCTQRADWGLAQIRYTSIVCYANIVASLVVQQLSDMQS